LSYKYDQGALHHPLNIGHAFATFVIECMRIAGSGFKRICFTEASAQVNITLQSRCSMSERCKE
jgi:hypothetical protein